MTNEVDKCAATPSAPVAITGSQFPRPGRLGLVGWHGTSWVTVMVVGETPKRYRIANHSTQPIKLAGRYRWLDPGQRVLVPKTAIRFDKVEPQERRTDV